MLVLRLRPLWQLADDVFGEIALFAHRLVDPVLANRENDKSNRATGNTDDGRRKCNDHLACHGLEVTACQCGQSGAHGNQCTNQTEAGADLYQQA